MPSVSVVIPTYNNAGFITEAFNSVLAQSFDDYEVIVVDDGSTDQTRDVVSGFGPRIRYHYQANQGLAVARNTGLRLATGDYLTYLDADDVWERDNLLVKMRVLQADPGLGGVFSEFVIFDRTGVRQARGTRHQFSFFARTGRDFDRVFDERGSVALPKGGQAIVLSGYVFESLFLGNFILPTSMVFSRSGARQVGDFRAELRTQQDYEYWLRFSQKFRLAFVDEPLVRYRRHENQLTDHRRIENIVVAVNRIVDQYEAEFSARGRGREFARRKAFLLTELAKVYIGQGRAVDARRCLIEGIRRDPTQLRAYATLAASLMPRQAIAWMRGSRTRAEP
jgi:glycosyltransferase involved in cell wall biosynthesis